MSVQHSSCMHMYEVTSSSPTPRNCVFSTPCDEAKDKRGFRFQARMPLTRMLLKQSGESITSLLYLTLGF